jgi:hypothetical protein
LLDYARTLNLIGPALGYRGGAAPMPPYQGRDTTAGWVLSDLRDMARCEGRSMGELFVCHVLVLGFRAPRTLEDSYYECPLVVSSLSLADG